MNEVEKHLIKSKNRKIKVDKGIAKAKIERGIMLVITGNGKGKSTAGYGMVTRCVGHGKKAAVVQFIKGKWACGERDLLQQHGVPFAVMGTGFTWETQNAETDRQAALQVWQQAKEFLADPSIHLVLLDELTYMLSYNYLPKDEVLLERRGRAVSSFVEDAGESAALRMSCHPAFRIPAGRASLCQPRDPQGGGRSGSSRSSCQLPRSVWNIELSRASSGLSIPV